MMRMGRWCAAGTAALFGFPSAFLQILAIREEGNLTKV
jgi:hypothetical protein